MKHQITCRCEHSFSQELPDTLDLDQDNSILEQLQNGTFMSFSCPSCGAILKPELPLMCMWPTRRVELKVIPESDRIDHFLRPHPTDVVPLVIGYAELLERLRILQHELNVLAVEAIKYYLFLKAEETYHEGQFQVWYHNFDGETLEFHIHGLKKDEIAVSKLPKSLYEKTLLESKRHPPQEPFVSLCRGSYISVHNLLKPEVDQ